MKNVTIHRAQQLKFLLFLSLKYRKCTTVLWKGMAQKCTYRFQYIKLMDAGRLVLLFHGGWRGKPTLPGSTLPNSHDCSAAGSTTLQGLKPH